MNHTAILAENIEAQDHVTQPIFSVTDISLSLKRHIEINFRNIRIKGEISGFKKHGSGHAYFAIKDDASVIDALVWRGTRLMIQPEDGAEVVITGRITTYPGRSKYQVIVEKMEALGQGALMTLLLQRKEKLNQQGYFARKRPLPQFPRRIGIITSPTGAVIRDILHRLEDRFPLHVLLWPALVQGAGSVEQVCQAITGFNQLEDHLKPDVLIVARGGGSLEDLWTFNEEDVVKAVATSQIPIISAIGHETDVTLCDFAADVRAPTPTAAAELATPVKSQLLGYLEGVRRLMYDNAIKQLRMHWVHVRGLSRGITHPRFLVENTMQRLDELSERFKRAMHVFLSNLSYAYHHINLKPPYDRIAHNTQAFGQTYNRFKHSALFYYTQQETAFILQATRLEQSNYTKILEKGFAWVETEGNVVARALEFPYQTKGLTLNFSDGCVDIEVDQAVYRQKAF